ncbi:MAG TPA: hypothetical protein VLB68_07500, partial [Pyrinomonadaceae bacterium]|nr:hypothetical protein [Pyrinomonadaceae bacterium]
MKTLLRTDRLLQFLLVFAMVLVARPAFGQPQNIAGANSSRNPGKPVTIPLTIRLKEEREPELQNIDLVVSEDGEAQTILSIRGEGNSPITLAL